MRIQHFIALVVLSLLTVPGAPAATTTWTGADPSGNWSAPANWSPAGVPVNGDALVFPGGLPLADMVSTNDLADSIFRSITFSGASRHTIRGNPITLTNRTDCIINSGTNVLACDLTFSGTPPTPTYTTIRSSSFDSGELTVIGNVGGGSLHVGNGRWRLVIMGQFTGGSLFVDWYSTLALYGDNPYAVSAFVSGSTLLVEGSQPNLNVAMYYNIEDVTPASLSGNGLIGDVTWVAGGSRITPDSTLSVKNVSAYSAIFRFNGTNVGEYGRLVASGSVNLGAGSLLPSPDFSPQAGQVYTIVEKTSPGPITNAFFGTSTFLGPEGIIITLNGMPFRLSYVGGDGNDVTLTVGTNARPTVTITNPPNAAVFSAPASFSLAASASDPDGSVTNVQFFRDATSLGNDSSSPYSASVNGLAAGTYTLSAVASDNRGLRATNSIVVTVAGPPAATNIWTGADPSGYWSAPANWSPAGVPVNGNDLVFPGGLPTADMVSTNDLPNVFFRSITFNQGSRHTIRGNPMTLTNSSALIASSGTNEIACDLILTATPPPSAPYYLWPRFNILYPGELTVSGNIAGSHLYPAGGRFVLRGQFPGGRMYAYGGTQAFYGDHAHALSVTNVGGTLFVRGSQPNLNLAMHWEMESADCPDLTAEGVVGDITGCGHIILDSTLSVKSLGGRGASQASWRVLDIRLNGTNVGEYGKLISSGDVTLTGASLTPTPGFNPQPGQVFTIVDKASPGPITTVPGYDTNLFGPEGKIITLNGRPFRLSYVGGDGNDVTLTALGFVPIDIPGLPGFSFGGAAAWGDYDNDGRLDLVQVGWGVSQLWRNTGSGFSNVTASIAPGLPGVSYGSVAWGDYDNDGRLDLLLTGSGISQLWRNTGSGFSNVTASIAPGLPGITSGSAAWGDFDNDGRLDFLLNSQSSQLWRNTGSGFSNVTASIAPGLPGGYRGFWGDYDNDGRIDLLIAGDGAGTQLWRNTGAGFSNVTASVAPGRLVGYAGAWGDYDSDGRLDLLLNGSGTIQLWRNMGAGFSNVTASVAPGLRGVSQSSVSWGDYDNDGRLDFLLTGTPDPEGFPARHISQLWRNTGTVFSNVTASVAPDLPGTASPVSWGDCDNDGRLDFLLTGRGQLWRNITPVSNAPPAAPTGLSSTLSGGAVSLSWNPPEDDRTPSAALNYNLRIGTAPGASDVLAPMALTDGLRLLPALGNAQAGTNAVMNLPVGRYYWSVQAVDTTFAGSPFAVEQQFTIAPRIIEPLSLGNGQFQFSFTNQSSAVYEVLGTTNVSLPVAQWTVLGPPVSLGGGLYQFTDALATNHAQRFYLLRAQ